MGYPRMRMDSVLDHAPMRFSFTLKDIRDWPADSLLQSNRFADQVLAILGGTSSGRDLVRQILGRLGGMKPPERNLAISYLATLSGLHRFGTILKQEAERMEVLIDWKKNPILRGIHEEGLEEGREEGLEKGLEKGLQKGREEGLRIALRTTLSSAFGDLPRWAEQKVDRGTPKQLTAWLAKVPAAKRIEDVIRAR